MRCGWAPSKIATGHYARVRERDGRFELLKGLDPAKDQSYFLHRLKQAQLAQDAVPGGRAGEDRGAPHRRRDRPAECEEEGLHRHLLHRRAAVPRVPAALPEPRARPHARRARPRGRPPCRPELLHAGPAPGPGHRRRARRRRRARALVRGAQGPGAQHAARGAGARPPLAAVDTGCRPTTRAGSPARRRAAGPLAAKTRYRQADAAVHLRARGRAASGCASTRRNGP